MAKPSIVDALREMMAWMEMNGLDPKDYELTPKVGARSAGFKLGSALRLEREVHDTLVHDASSRHQYYIDLDGFSIYVDERR